MLTKRDALRKKEDQIAGALVNIGFEVQRAPRNGKRVVIMVKRKEHCAKGEK